LAGNRVVIVCLTVWENAGMPENYRLMMAMNIKEKIIKIP
jgi:hypothetical protein